LTEFLYSKAQIREALDPAPSTPDDDMQWLAGATPEVIAHVRATLPARRTPAAVLVPLVEHADGFTVLLTQRATTLRDHAGQISFPGGRIESEDADPWHAALREAQEEIGLKPELVEFTCRIMWWYPVFVSRRPWASSSRNMSCRSPPPKYTMSSRCRWILSWMPPITSRAAEKSVNYPSLFTTSRTAIATSGAQRPAC
jgi:hypothetical protein